MLPRVIKMLNMATNWVCVVAWLKSPTAVAISPEEKTATNERTERVDWKRINLVAGHVCPRRYAT